jgi:hypothetical protein
MAYTPFHADWKDFPDTTTPISAAALEHIEAGIAAAASGPASGNGLVNVKDYGAVGNGVADDTAAIQAALNDVKHLPTPGTFPLSPVLIPAGNYMFSNLTIPAYTHIVGHGWARLVRITGSTGTAIREQTPGEGNTFGAVQIVIDNLVIEGSSTTGNGLDLGSQQGGLYSMSSGSRLEHILVNGFPSGIGIKLNANADYFAHLYGWNCQTGIQIVDTGACQFFNISGAANTSYQLDLSGVSNVYYGVECESLINNATPMIRWNTNGGGIFGGYVAYTGGTTKPHMIFHVAGVNGARFLGMDFAGSGAFTHGVWHEAQAQGSGSKQFQDVWIDSSVSSSWRINGSTGDVTSLVGSRSLVNVGAQGVEGLTYGATVTSDGSRYGIKRLTVTNGTGFTIANPTNPLTGTRLTYEIRNSSGGAMGTLTWGSDFRLGGAFTNPANGFRKTISFWYDSAAWMQDGAVSADVAI